LLVFQEILLSIHFHVHLDSPPRWRLVLLALLFLASVSSTVSAQTAPDAAPLAKQMPDQPPAFRSAFEGYKPYTDDGAPDWKKANEEVGNIGGWRVYAREAQGDAKGEEKGQVQPAQTNQPDPHTGHTKP
jgi:hypothetical protein